MSQQTFVTFYEDFLAQPENAELVASFDAIDSEESFASKAVEVGSQHGFSFTAADVSAVMTASVKKQLESVELTDQQLEAIAGGVFSLGSPASSLVSVNLNKLSIGGISPKLDQVSYSTVMCPW